jgi:hypothetical protein
MSAGSTRTGWAFAGGSNMQVSAKPLTSVAVRIFQALSKSRLLSVILLLSAKQIACQGVSVWKGLSFY